MTTGDGPHGAVGQRERPDQGGARVIAWRGETLQGKGGEAGRLGLYDDDTGQEDGGDNKGASHGAAPLGDEGACGAQLALPRRRRSREVWPRG